MKRVAEKKAAKDRKEAATKMVEHKRTCPVCSKETVAISISEHSAVNAFVLCKVGADLTERKVFFEGLESGIWRGVHLGWNRARAR